MDGSEIQEFVKEFDEKISQFMTVKIAMNVEEKEFGAGFKILFG